MHLNFSSKRKSKWLSWFKKKSKMVAFGLKCTCTTVETIIAHSTSHFSSMQFPFKWILRQKKSFIALQADAEYLIRCQDGDCDFVGKGVVV